MGMLSIHSVCDLQRHVGQEFIMLKIIITVLFAFESEVIEAC